MLNIKVKKIFSTVYIYMLLCRQSHPSLHRKHVPEKYASKKQCNIPKDPYLAGQPHGSDIKPRWNTSSGPERDGPQKDEVAGQGGIYPFNLNQPARFFSSNISLLSPRCKPETNTLAEQPSTIYVTSFRTA
jgi:hypothetical protein